MYDISLIDIISLADPTTTYKYLPFLIKILKKNNQNDNMLKLIVDVLIGGSNIEYIKRFEEHSVAKRISNSDISSYDIIQELIQEVKKGDEIVKLKELEKQIIKIYDDKNWLVLTPLTYEASKIYGANTRWCITQKSTWDDYQWSYKLIFIICKTTNQKWAISKNYNSPLEIKGWKSNDDEIHPMNIPIPPEIWVPLMIHINKPKYQSEFELLKPETIILRSGEYKSVDSADINEINWFINKFENLISPELREKCNGISTKEPNPVKKDDFYKYLNELLSKNHTQHDYDDDIDLPF